MYVCKNLKTREGAASPPGGEVKGWLSTTFLLFDWGCLTELEKNDNFRKGGEKGKEEQGE